MNKSLAELKHDRLDPQQETERVAALAATGILDTPAEPGFDAICRLAGEYFQVDWAGISFADETRIWIKACWGQKFRELPRSNSVFDLVLAQDGPIVIPDICQVPELDGHLLSLKVLNARFFAAVPVRTFSQKILGLLIIYGRDPRSALTPDQLSLLEGLAAMVASDLERRRLRNSVIDGKRPLVSQPATGDGSWPRRSDLRRALEERQFVLYYQPEIDLSTRQIIGVEALIRWQHPERGMIPPNDFIPAAEKNGLILPIGDWALEEACRQIDSWCRDNAANSSLRVCVNLSARQFSRPGLADHIQALLLQYGLSSRQLGLEMTESSLIPDISTASEVLASLKKLGVSLLLDDFGTGYSSLNHLHSFPFDVLKIDGSFIRRITGGEQTMQIVRTIIELARVLGMDVVAECIETGEQYQMLQDLGCRLGQGYLLARPMSAAAVTELLRLPGRVLPES